MAIHFFVIDFNCLIDKNNKKSCAAEIICYCIKRGDLDILPYLEQGCYQRFLVIQKNPQIQEFQRIESSAHKKA